MLNLRSSFPYISLFYFNLEPNKSKKVDLIGYEGLYLKEELSSDLKLELAWGSEMFLTASAAASILIYLNGEVILKRGLITDEEFTPKDICTRSLVTNKLISLVNTKFYPGKDEFDSILKGLPSIMVYPIFRIFQKGLIIFS